jgi:hypothetical protein
VNEEDAGQPVTLLLLVSAPPPRPEVLAQIVLPSDKPMAGVDMAIDANKDLAFPSNSFLGQGAFGQVSSVCVSFCRYCGSVSANQVMAFEGLEF